MRSIAAFIALFYLTMPAFAGVPQHDENAQLDKLFADLAKTTSPDQAKPVEDRIMALFVQSGGPTVDLLMKRASIVLEAGDKDTTKKIIYAITTIAPGYAEGWHRRAMLEAAANDDSDAMISLEKTVTLNPREFEAQAELGKLLEAYGDKKAALAAYRKALAVDPHMEGVDSREQQLAREVEGEKI
jgi:Flp pilus assembly protein TadD